MKTNCQYSYYNSEEIQGKHFLNCSITGQICPMVRFCSQVGRIVNVDGYANCNVSKKHIEEMTRREDVVKEVVPPLKKSRTKK